MKNRSLPLCLALTASLALFPAPIRAIADAALPPALPGGQFISQPPSPMSTGRLAGALLSIVSDAKTTSSEPISRTGFFFDTVVTITLYDTEDTTILDACDDLMAECENRLSRTREGSDIWKINHAEGAAVEVSDETVFLIERALDYCALSDGAFDITIAPVVSLWDFHEDAEPKLPEEKALAEALTHVDYHIVSVEGNQVQLSDPEAGIDLGAIAKGYISDLLRDKILSCGCESAVITLGGNVMTVGRKPDGSDFRIGIRRPFGTSAYDCVAVVSVHDLSVITSGTYERYFDLDGRRYHHILNPDTGYSIENGLTSVSILSADGTDGDALSTTCFVLGPEKGMELIESLDGIEAMFIFEDETMMLSTGWPLENNSQR